MIMRNKIADFVIQIDYYFFFFTLSNVNGIQYKIWIEIDPSNTYRDNFS